MLGTQETPFFFQKPIFLPGIHCETIVNDSNTHTLELRWEQLQAAQNMFTSLPQSFPSFPSFP